MNGSEASASFIKATEIFEALTKSRNLISFLQYNKVEEKGRT